MDEMSDLSEIYREQIMRGFGQINNLLAWSVALLLVTFVAGCGAGPGPGGGNLPPEVLPPVSAAKTITAYSFAGVSGTINESARTIAVTVPFGTDVTTLVATFTSTGANVKVGTTLQTSSSTANDFTGPVAYIVTAADASTKTYIVTVTVATNTARAMTAFSFVGYSGASGTINEPAKTVAVTVPFGTDVHALVATFNSTGVSIKVGTVVQTSAATTNDFTSPMTYIVTAADASTASYIVTVTVASNTAKAMTAFSFVGYTGAIGTINESSRTIAVTVPFGTDVAALVATFASTGVGVKVGTALQTSASTANDFAGPLAYIVTAADASTETYIVTVTVAANSAKAMTAFLFAGYSGAAGMIDETAKTIAVTVPFATNVTALVATFTNTGISADVGTTVQTSTATANDFTSPVVYTVTAADASTAIYTVTVTVAPSTGPNLKRVASFAVLAGTTLTNAGTTTVTGDVAAASLAGIALTVTGAYDPTCVTAACANARTDLPSVIVEANDIALFPCGTSIGGTLTGVTLTPGVICIASNAAILNTGIVTLNGAGAYIIRTTAAFTPAATSSVVFSGTATSINTSVFWVVGSASLGANSIWMGTILTNGAVTLGDYDTLLGGRVLTTGPVTLSNNIITIP